MENKDKAGQDLLNGLLLLLRVYPDSKARIGYDQDISVEIPHIKNNLTKEEIELLEDWGWKWDYGKSYNEDISWWNYSMRYLK